MINCQLGSLFDQKTIAILGFRNPLRRLTAATPRRAGFRIAILRCNRSAWVRCNGATPTENLQTLTTPACPSNPAQPSLAYGHGDMRNSPTMLGLATFGTAADPYSGFAMR